MTDKIGGRQGKGKPRPNDPSGGRGRRVLKDEEIDDVLDRLSNPELAEAERDRLMAALWPAQERMPGILVARLSTGRSKFPMLDFLLLSIFAGEDSVEYLREIAEDEEVADIVRLGAFRRAGPEEEERQPFLTTLKSPVETLTMALFQGSSSAPPDVEVLEETVKNALALDPSQRLDLMAAGVDVCSSGGSVFYRCLLHAPDKETQSAALKYLVKAGDRFAIRAIDRLIATTKDTALRKAAKDVRRRLNLTLVDKDGGEFFEEMLPPIDKVYLSSIDGDGGQDVVVVRNLSNMGYTFGTLFSKDGYGVKETMGAALATKELVDEMMQGFKDEGILMVSAELADAQGALQDALALNVQLGNRYPPDLEVWEPLFCQAGEAIWPAGSHPELDDAPYASRRDLLSQVGPLLDRVPFQSWFFDPEDIVPFFPKQAVDDPLSMIFDRAFEGLVTDEFKVRLRQRLRRQAWLLDRLRRRKDRDIALAAAAALAPDSPVSTANHPLIVEMLRRGIASALQPDIGD